MGVQKASCVGHHLPGHFGPFLLQSRYPSCWGGAALAEERKVAKYNGLPVTHSFTPVAIETLGADWSKIFGVPEGVGLEG